MSDRQLAAVLAQTTEGIATAVKIFQRLIAAQTERIIAAELGPHGRSDVIRALDGEREALRQTLEYLECAAADLDQVADDVDEANWG